MRPVNRRRAAESLASDRRPPPPTPINSTDPRQFTTPGPRRDSDASFCSSRHSNASIANAGPNISDRSYQLSCVRTINVYLASQSLPFSLKPPLPSAKDITDTLKHLLHRFGFDSPKLDEDLSHTLKFLKCPHKLNKSALRAPGTPHSWPNLLAVIHWLVQAVKYKDYVEENSTPSFESNRMLKYAVTSYRSYIKGDDDAVEALDEEFVSELSSEKDKMEENVRVLQENVKELEAKLERLRSGPSQREMIEQEKLVLENDVGKFHDIIKQVDDHLVKVQDNLEGKNQLLEATVKERKRFCDENDELKKKIEEQGINSRDAERMKRELQAIERDIEETEAERNRWEEKIWQLDSEIGNKFKELEGLVMDCNQAIRRLKIGNGFQYQLNPSGSSPAKVLGLDYKSILKPALKTLDEYIKNNSIEKFDELIALRKQSADNAAKIEEKKNRMAVLQSQINEVEAQLNLLKQDMYNYVSRCTAEARRMVEEAEVEAQKIYVVEKEAEELLMKSKAELQETITQTEKEIQLCARELFDLINSVSAHKEYMTSKISWMGNDLLETVSAIADMHKGNRPSQPR